MRHIVLILLIALSTNIDVFSQEVIYMTKEDGVYTVPCEVNGLRLKFIFDTGASDVSISLSEAIFMLKNGYLSENDIEGSTYYQIANGDVVEGTTIILRQIKIGTKTLYNIEASIVHSLTSPLLLGQSALSKLGKFSFDYSNNTLVFGGGSYNSPNNRNETNRNYNNNNDEPLTTTMKDDGKLRISDFPSSDIIKIIPKGATVRVIENKKDYWKVLYDGKTGYLNEMYLNITYSMSDLQCVNNNSIMTTTKIDGKLRSSVFPDSDIIKYIPKGASVRVIENKADYWKVFFDGKTGFLNEMYLNITYDMTLMKN